MWLVFALLARAGDPATAHPHPASLAPIASRPAELALNAEERATLDRGDPVLRHTRIEGGGSGVAVQRIGAAPARVWAVILDYDRYDERVSTVRSATVYRREGERFWLDMQSSVLGFRTALYTINTVHRDQGWMAWSLDRERTSDVEDLVGYWLIVAEGAGTRLEHGTTLALRGVPDFVARYLTREALLDGTAWVKAAAEGR